MCNATGGAWGMDGWMDGMETKTKPNQPTIHNYTAPHGTKQCGGSQFITNRAASYLGKLHWYFTVPSTRECALKRKIE